MWGDVHVRHMDGGLQMFQDSFKRVNFPRKQTLFQIDTPIAWSSAEEDMLSSVLIILLDHLWIIAAYPQRHDEAL